MDISKSIVKGKTVDLQFRNIVEAFEKVVDEKADQCMLSDGNKSLTYCEANSISNRIARGIISKQGHIQNVIGIRMDKSMDYVILVLAILKSGNIYMPIDIDLPANRVEEMRQESNMIMMISNMDTDRILYQSKDYGIEELHYMLSDEQNLQVDIAPDDLAYILYTSGTTGKQKGAMISHIGIVNLVQWYDGLYNIKDKNSILLSNMGFDPSIEEMFGAILSGGTLFVPTTNILKHINYFNTFIMNNNINVVQFIPNVLRKFIANNNLYLNTIDVLISGGDILDDKLKDEVIKKGYRLCNHYGPTEVSVDSLAYECIEGEKVSVGYPVDNYVIALIDEFDNVTPVGESGELCIGGIGVGRGYVGNQKRTEESYVKFSFEPDVVFYKTKDKCKVNEDGSISILGRMDNQTKVRGKRIELFEITKMIKLMEDIDECEVLVREVNGNDKIFAFYTARKEIEVGGIKEKLIQQFPLYMIPDFFYQLENMPITINGKNDVKLLRCEDIEKINGMRSNKEVTINEQKVPQAHYDICMVLFDILKSQDDIRTFYGQSLNEVGLDSLSYVELIVKLEDKFKIEIEVEALSIDYFDDVKGICEYIYKMVQKERNTI